MATETIKSKLEEFVTDSTALGETAYKLVRTNTTLKIADVTAKFTFQVITSVLILFVILFCSFAASLWFGDLLHSRIAGFLLMGGIYFFILLVLLLLKRKSILPYFRNKSVKKINE